MSFVLVNCCLFFERAGRVFRDVRGGRDDFVSQDDPGHRVDVLLLLVGRFPAGPQGLPSQGRLVAGMFAYIQYVHASIFCVPIALSLKYSIWSPPTAQAGAEPFFRFFFFVARAVSAKKPCGTRRRAVL